MNKKFKYENIGHAGTPPPVLFVLALHSYVTTFLFSSFFFFLSFSIIRLESYRLLRCNSQQNNSFDRHFYINSSRLLFFYSSRFYLYRISNCFSHWYTMPESEIIITLDNDEELLNSKEIDSNTSPNSLKTKRTRLTFPFGAW